MAIAIRGTTPVTANTTTATVSVTLTGTRQPQVGDILLIIHCNDYYALSNMPTPTVGGSTTGVNAITGTGLPADGGSLFGHAKPYVYKVTSTGDLTVSVTETSAGDEEKALVVFVLSGVDATTQVDVASGSFNSSTNSGTSHICPSVSPASADAFLICHANDGGGASSGATVSNPSGMTGSYDVTFGGMSYRGATQQLSASGSTGTKTFTVTGSNRNYASLTIAVKTAAGGSTVNGTVTMAGAGSASAVVRQQAGAAMAAAGTSSAAVVQRVPASLTGTAALAAVVSQRATSALAGTSTLAAPVRLSAPATLAGAATLAAASGSVVTGIATMAATSSLSVAPRQTAGTALAGSASLSASAVQQAPAQLAGVGSLVAAVGAGAITPRPDTGTTARPNAGITARPDSGVTPRP